MNSRRKFLKGTLAASSLLAVNQLLGIPRFVNSDRAKENEVISKISDRSFYTPGILKGMPIRATFLDEISWDIPHQNWGAKDWDLDFKSMKEMGINTVVMIRSGLGKWIASDFKCLLEKEEVYYPPIDLVELFLSLADKYNMAFFFWYVRFW